MENEEEKNEQDYEENDMNDNYHEKDEQNMGDL